MNVKPVASWVADEQISLNTAREGTKAYQLIKFLGGGATSVVWKAEEVSNNIEVPRKTVALKVLRDDGFERWAEVFEDEIAVLRKLWQTEKDLNDGWHAIPEVYDVSPKGGFPAFLSMEYVPLPGVDSLAAPNSDIPKRAKQLQKDLLQLYDEFDLFVLSAGSQLTDSTLKQNLKNLPLKVNDLQDEFRPLLHQVEDDFADLVGLTDLEIALIGSQMCRVLQLLHSIGRSYQDFQLQNIRWDTRRKQIKVIDWNVVTAEGTVNLERGEGQEYVRRDLDTLATFLFWLRTLTSPPTQGSSLRLLEIIGGATWTKNTSPLLRSALEKALSPDIKQRFLRAYSFKEDDHYFLRSPAMGNALTSVAHWLKETNTARLLDDVERYKEQKRWSEAGAILFQAKQTLPVEHEAIRKILSPRLNSLNDEIQNALYPNRSRFEQGQRLMELLNFSEAVSRFEEAVREIPTDVEAHRWLILAKQMSLLSKEEAEEFWRQPNLKTAMGALHYKRWTEARTLFDSYPSFTGSLLKWDAAYHETVSSAERCWANLHWDRLAPDQDNSTIETKIEREAEKLKGYLDSGEEIVKKIHSVPANYLEEIIKEQWFQLTHQWRERIESIESQSQATKLSYQSNYDDEGKTLRAELTMWAGRPELIDFAIETAVHLLEHKKTQQAFELLNTVRWLNGRHGRYTEIKGWLYVAEISLRIQETGSSSSPDKARLTSLRSELESLWQRAIDIFPQYRVDQVKKILFQVNREIVEQHNKEQDRGKQVSAVA